MATELYDISIPVFLRGFRTMSAYLEKARAHAETNGIPEADLIEARLIEDMHALPAQVQRASDAAKLFAVRTGQLDNVPMQDEEKSFAELQDRIARTVAFLEAVPPAAINGREDAEITITLPNRSFTWTGRAYLLDFAMPNFYFHLTAAYAILRHKGAPLGKMDFLGGA